MNYEKILKIYAPTINEISREARNVILKFGLALQQSSTLERTKVLAKISNEYGIEKTKLVEIIAAYIEITRLFLVTNDKEFKEILNQAGFSTTFIEELPLIQNREEVANTILNSKRVENRNVVALKWKIDISLYNELLNKNVKTVIIQINLRNGKKHTLEVDVKTFHKLRYTISLILKELVLTKNMLQ